MAKKRVRFKTLQKKNKPIHKINENELDFQGKKVKRIEYTSHVLADGIKFIVKYQQNKVK